jgi:hypothetical protein
MLAFILKINLIPMYYQMVKDQINPKGLQYYNNLINELISHGMQSLHWDLPQSLEDEYEYEGWISEKISVTVTSTSVIKYTLLLQDSKSINIW